MSQERPVFFVPIKERVLLNKPGSDKATYHIVLDLKGLNVAYNVGDCVGVLPTNPLDEVNKLLSILSVSKDHEIVDREGSKQRFDLFLLNRANLSKVTKKLALFCKERLPAHKKEEVESWLTRERGPFLENTNLVDFLSHFQPQLSPQEFSDHLLPQLPRLYSIASSMHEVGDEIHLLVKLSEYGDEKTKKLGTCSRFLCQEAPLNVPIIPIYLDLNREFTLPSEKERPIIMIGPGTGVAPFRGFLQERIKLQSSKKNWLFFGERKSAFDFYYEDFFKELASQGALKLDLAFSRDQAEKVYVQHLLLKNAPEIWQWLQMGSYLYVCGDATNMAKDVDLALQKIACQEGKLSEKEAREYFRSLKREKRYLRDVY